MTLKKKTVDVTQQFHEKWLVTMDFVSCERLLDLDLGFHREDLALFLG